MLWGAVIQAVIAQLGSNGITIKNHGTDKMECFPKDRELLKGKAHTHNHKILQKNKGKKTASNIVNPGLEKHKDVKDLAAKADPDGEQGI